MHLEDTVIEVIIQGPQGPAGNAPYDGIRNGVIDTSPTENAVFDALISKAELEHTHTWDEVLNTPTTFPPSTHNHIISEVEGLQNELNGKADAEHSHNATDIDGLLGILESKAPKVHDHTIGEVTNLQNTLNSKASVIHTHIISDVDGLQEDLNTLQDNINTKAPLVHNHTIGQVINLQNTLNTKSDVGHGHNIADVSELQDELDNKAPVGHTHTFSEVSGVSPIIHNHLISEISGLQPVLDSKSDVSHSHTPNEIGAIATDGSSIVTGPIVFNDDSEVKLQLDTNKNIATGSGKLVITNAVGPIVLETTSPNIKQGGVEYEIYHKNNIPTPAEVGAVNKTGDEMSGGLKALNFQARDIAQGMRGIWIGGGADYSEVIPVDTLGSILWTESIRYFPNADKWTLQSSQGTAANSITRKDYVDTGLANKLNLSGGVLTGPLTLAADGVAGSAQAATVRQIPTRKKIEVRWTGLTTVLVSGVPTNIINLLKLITPASGTMGPFLNTTSDKLNVYNDDASVGIKINITGSFAGNNINRSMHLDFLGTSGNRVVVNRNQGGVAPPDIMQFRTFLSIDKNGNVATNGTAMEIMAAGADFTINEVVIIIEQLTALTSITPV